MGPLAFASGLVSDTERGCTGQHKQGCRFPGRVRQGFPSPDRYNALPKLCGYSSGRLIRSHHVVMPKLRAFGAYHLLYSVPALLFMTCAIKLLQGTSWFCHISTHVDDLIVRKFCQWLPMVTGAFRRSLLIPENPNCASIKHCAHICSGRIVSG